MIASSFRARHLSIVGMGLMGGSLALALRDHADHVTGIDSCETTRSYALQQGFVDSATDDLFEGVNHADVVILAAPVRVIVEMLQMRIGSYLRSNTLVVDLGSTKQDIVDAMADLPIGVNAVGGHPMTGKENGGIEESDRALYENPSLCFMSVSSYHTGGAASGHIVGGDAGRFAYRDGSGEARSDRGRHQSFALFVERDFGGDDRQSGGARQRLLGTGGGRIPRYQSSGGQRCDDDGRHIEYQYKGCCHIAGAVSYAVGDAGDDVDRGRRSAIEPITAADSTCA